MVASAVSGVVAAESLAAFCEGQIAGYKAPRAVVHVSELVRSPSGKADYRWAKAVAKGEIPAP